MKWAWLDRGKKQLSFYKITLQNPNPSDFAALKNFSFDWSIQWLSAIQVIITEKLRIHHEFATKNTVHFQERSASQISALTWWLTIDT